jgi:hypothetical protein
MTMIIAKKDKNHKHIADTLRRCGWIVLDTSWSRGKLLDLIAYRPGPNVRFIEVKGKGKNITDCEREFILDHPECSRVVHDDDEAMRI